MLKMGHKRFVSLTFDVDGETLWGSRDEENWNRPVTLSHGEYGPKVGVPRILKLLNRYSIKSTFFIPGWIIENYEETIKQINGDGHEIGHHGYLHEHPHTLSPDKEKEVLMLGIKKIKKAIGKEPVGYRSPAWEFSPYTLKYLKEFNFKYSSNMMDNDKPYMHQNGIVEMPVNWMLDDAPFFIFNPRLTGRLIQPTDSIFEIWKAEFSALYEEEKPFILTLHPQIIGRAHRVKHLENFIQFILKHENIEFVTLEKLAQVQQNKNDAEF